MCLLRLAEPLHFPSVAGVRPVCLPAGQDKYERVAGLLAGWGRVHPGGPLSPSLQRAPVRVLPQKQASTI